MSQWEKGDRGEAVERYMWRKWRKGRILDKLYGERGGEG